MDVEAIVAEIGGLQDEIKDRGRRVHALATSLYRRTRRATPDDSTVIYMAYANAQTRFAGMVEQVIQRTVRTARVLKRLPVKEAQEAQESPKIKKREDRTAPQPTESPMESLIGLYSEAVPSGADDPSPPPSGGES